MWLSILSNQRIPGAFYDLKLHLPKGAIDELEKNDERRQVVAFLFDHHVISAKAVICVGAYIESISYVQSYIDRHTEDGNFNRECSCGYIFNNTISKSWAT